MNPVQPQALQQRHLQEERLANPPPSVNTPDGSEIQSTGCEVEGLIARAVAAQKRFDRCQAAHARKIARLRSGRCPPGELAAEFIAEHGAALAEQDWDDRDAADVFNALADFADAHDRTFEEMASVAAFLCRSKLVSRHAARAWAVGGRDVSHRAPAPALSKEAA